jgi:hypothetical protein
MRWKDFDTSMSMPWPPICGKNSIAVTFEPKRLHTEPLNNKQSLLDYEQQQTEKQVLLTDQFEANHARTNHDYRLGHLFQRQGTR